MADIPTIEELFERPIFVKSFTDASRKLARKTNALEIAIAYTNLSILQELKEIKELLKNGKGEVKEKETKRIIRKK